MKTGLKRPSTALERNQLGAKTGITGDEKPGGLFFRISAAKFSNHPPPGVASASGWLQRRPRQSVKVDARQTGRHSFPVGRNRLPGRRRPALRHHRANQLVWTQVIGQRRALRQIAANLLHIHGDAVDRLDFGRRAAIEL